MALNRECLNHVLGRLDPMTFLSVYPHSSAPCHNLKFDSLQSEIDNIEHFSGWFKTVPYNISCPVPVSFPSDIEKNVISGSDPALDLVKSKKNWEDCKRNILKFCDEKDIEIRPGTSNKVEVPLNVMLLTHHLKKDPDQHFNANYNSYHNRTNIACLDSRLGKFLIRPTSYGKGDIVLSRLNLNQSPWDIDGCNLTSNTGIPGPIYEINAKKNIIVTRQKQNISLFSLEETENELSLLNKLTVNKSCPFVSICTNGSNFCTLSAERELQIFDSAVGRQVFQETFFDDTAMSDNWASIFYIDENTLSYLDRSSCGVIDLRVKNEVKKWCIQEFTEQCEEVYTGGIGKNNLQYIVTSHQVLSLDLRVGFSQRWTHGIGHSPCIMSVLSTSTAHDMLFIGSQRNDKVVFIENDRIEGQSCSKIQPYSLPSLRETFHLAQYNGCCLSNTVGSRFAMSLTGLCCIESDDEIILFSSTSVGDVFKQTLKKSSAVNKLELNKDELNKLENWEEQCEDLLLEMNNPCYVTNLLDDTNILECIRDNKKLYNETRSKLEKCKAEWNISKKELLSYCDYLAPRILEEWGIEDDEEWCELSEKTLDEISSDDEDNVTDRVMKWIEKYSEEMTANADDDPDEVREESRVEEDNDVDTKSPALEESEKDLKPEFSILEPSFISNKMTTSTPRPKFTSGF